MWFLKKAEMSDSCTQKLNAWVKSVSIEEADTVSAPTIISNGQFILGWMV